MKRKQYIMPTVKVATLQSVCSLMSNSPTVFNPTSQTDGVADAKEYDDYWDEEYDFEDEEDY